MKKLIIAITLITTVSIAKSQQLSLGLDLGLPLSDLNDAQGIGIGVTGKLHYPLQDKLQLTATTGYMSFAGKTVNVGGFSIKTDNFGIVPLKGGIRFGLANNLFLEPEVGLWFGNNGWGTSFAYGAGVYTSWGHFDLGGRFEGSSKNSVNAWLIGLRGAYKFDLGSKK